MGASLSPVSSSGISADTLAWVESGTELGTLLNGMSMLLVSLSLSHMMIGIALE